MRSQDETINNEGYVVGYYQIIGSDSAHHGFIYDGNEIKTIEYPGAWSTDVLGINDLGQMVVLATFEDFTRRVFIFDGNDFDEVHGFFASYPWYPTDLTNTGRIVGYLQYSNSFIADPVFVLTIDDILELFDDSVANGSLTGDGPGKSANGRLNALRNMLDMAGDLIAIGDIEGACGQLKAASRKCDGERKPPDFVAGDAVNELYEMIVELMAELGCE